MNDKTAKIKVPFPSLEWADRYMQILNKSEEYEKAAKTWEGSLLLVVKAQGNLTKVDINVWLDLWHGKCREYKFVYSQDQIEADFVFEGTESKWVSLMEGSVDPIKGLMAGKFRLTGGNMTPIMRHVRAAQLLVNALQAFEFDYLVTDGDPSKDAILEFYDASGEKIMIMNQEKKEMEFLG
ncbi:sterol carrier protein [Candidatus Bathyarchaeota archaeon]|nr:sterol carrier protein [Candidatus Bathyarchaeota archaeon]